MAHRHVEHGISHMPSKYSVSETIQRVSGLVQSKGLTVFPHIDFSGHAGEVGLRMRPTQLLIRSRGAQHCDGSAM